MNDQAHLRHPAADRLENSVEWHHDKIKVFRRFAEPQLQGQESAGHGPRHRDFFPQDFFPGPAPFCDQHWTVTVAHAGAAREQRVLAGHMRIGMDADGGDVQFAAQGTLVQSLDVLQDVLETIAPHRDQVLRQRVKHERIVRVGRMAKRERLLIHAFILQFRARLSNKIRVLQ